MYINTGSNILLDAKPFTVAGAGSSRDNYFLLGLRYKITVKTFGEVRAVYLYSSGTFGSEENRFEFTKKGNVYTYEETAGTGATALTLAPGENFTDGVCFYFRIKVVGQNLDNIKNYRFWVRDPENAVLIGTQQIPYVSPYPVMVGSRDLPVSFFPGTYSDRGTKYNGGAATVEVFDTPTAPNPGGHVTAIPETAIENVSSVTLVDRTGGATIPGFVPPPGAPDYSMFFHYLTFRFRAAQGSSYYKDVPIIVFASRKCFGPSGDYGYDSTGEGLPKPTPQLLLLDDPENPPTYPPPTCSSTTYLKPAEGSTFNVYSQGTTVKIYDSASGGNLLGSAPATIIDKNNIAVQRIDFGGDTSQPLSGYFEVTETGTDRTSSNRYETIVYGCSVTPVLTPVPSGGGGTVTVTTGGGDRVFDPEKEYIIVYYEEKYGAGVEYEAVVVGDHELEFEVTENLDGWFEIKEDDVVISKKEEITASAVDQVTVITNIDSRVLTKTGNANGYDFYGDPPLTIPLNSVGVGVNGEGLTIWVFISVPSAEQYAIYNGPTPTNGPAGTYSFLTGTFSLGATVTVTKP